MTGVGVALAATFYVALGLMAFVRPGNLLVDFGIEVGGPNARNEIRAVYGGLPLAFGGVLLSSLYGGAAASGMQVAVAVATLGMAAGRLVSALIDHRLERYPATFLIVELVIAALIMAAH
jgi:Domain of unknown function (DUF4345)